MKGVRREAQDWDRGTGVQGGPGQDRSTGLTPWACRLHHGKPGTSGRRTQLTYATSSGVYFRVSPSTTGSQEVWSYCILWPQFPPFSLRAVIVCIPRVIRALFRCDHPTCLPHGNFPSGNRKPCPVSPNSPSGSTHSLLEACAGFLVGATIWPASSEGLRVAEASQNVRVTLGAPVFCNQPIPSQSFGRQLQTPDTPLARVKDLKSPTNLNHLQSPIHCFLQLSFINANAGRLVYTVSWTLASPVCSITLVLHWLNFSALFIINWHRSCV